MFAIYYDYTGAGRGPEIIAGPFDTEQEAQQYAKENGWEGGNYFVDVYRDNY
jgi:hypothetical protein